jgi:hypothetical protein
MYAATLNGLYDLQKATAGALPSKSSNILVRRLRFTWRSEF